MFCSRGRNVYVQFSSHQELTTMDQSQGRGDEVGVFCVHIFYLKECTLYLVHFLKNHVEIITFIFCMISPMSLYVKLSHFTGPVLNCYVLYIPLSLYHFLPLFILLSLYLFSFSVLSCCRELSGCTAKPNPLSYNSSHAVSYNSGCAVSSIFTPWICGKDCNISEVSWSDFQISPFLFFPSLSAFFISGYLLAKLRL